jgi:4-hydroxy-tetrahydrodipicolinate synthase
MSFYFQVWTAIITPFNKKGEIDWQCFEQVLRHQMKGGVTGIVVAGTTGESPTISDEEKLRMVEFARGVLPKSIRIMAGTGSNCTQKSVELSVAAVSRGADSLLVVTPPYNKPTIDGLKAHFRAIKSSVKVPICLYHVPGRTGQLLSASALTDICREVEIPFVKEASGDLALFSKSAQLSSETEYLSGDDFTYLPSLSVGGRGVVSVVTNLFPSSFVKMGQAFSDGKLNDALAIHRALYPFIETLFVESNPGPIKQAMSLCGLSENHLRLPLVTMGSQNAASLKDALIATIRDLKKLGIEEASLSEK